MEVLKGGLLSARVKWRNGFSTYVFGWAGADTSKGQWAQSYDFWKLVHNHLKGYAMAASIHPPLVLNIILDHESYSIDPGVQMERRFTQVAPTEVKRSSKGSERANVLLLDVDMSLTDREADDPLWQDALITWFNAQFGEINNLIKRENEARMHKGEQQLILDWLEVQFAGGLVIAIRLISSDIPESAAGYIDRARALLKEGAMGADPVRSVGIPSQTSILAQIVQSPQDGGDWADELQDASSLAGSDVAGLGQLDEDNEVVPVDENLGSESHEEVPTHSEIDEALAEAEGMLNQRDYAGDSKLFHGCLPDALDYRVWDIEYKDGTSIHFDSVLGEAVFS